MPYVFLQLFEDGPVLIGGGMNIGDPVTGSTGGSVLFADGSGNLAQDNANLAYDSTNRHLKIGTTPTINIGEDPTLSSYAGMWVGAASPNSTNFFLLSNGNSAYINALSGGSVEFSVGGSVIATIGYNGLGVGSKYIQDRFNTVAYLDTDVSTGKAWGIYNQTSSRVALTVHGHASQAVDTFQIADNTGATQCAFAKNGAFKPASLADASAPNNSIYYSSDAAKLVYKDSGGTVNNLY